MGIIRIRHRRSIILKKDTTLRLFTCKKFGNSLKSCQNKLRVFRYLLFIQEKQLSQLLFYPPNSVIKLSILKVLDLEAKNYLLDIEIKEGNDNSSFLFSDSYLRCQHSIIWASL